MGNIQKIALVTGAGSGFGLETALLLAGRNYRVFGSVLTEAEGAALRAAAASRSVNIEVLSMDVTRQDQVKAAVESLIAMAGRIDCVVQFAGMGLRGFFEDLTLDEIRRVYDVNVFGIMAVTQAVLPYMRKQRGGRIVLTTSAAGRMGSMSIAGYCSSKFAVEGLAECLRQEVRPFNIFVSLLEPGLVATPHFTVNRNRGRRAADPSSPYYLWFCQHEKIVDDLLARNKFTARDVAETACEILRSRNPRLHYLVGFKARLIVNLKRYSPGEWFESLYSAMVRRMVTKPKVQATTLSGMEYTRHGQSAPE